MINIIREKYESGILISREVEVHGHKAIEIARLCIQAVIAISVAVIAVTYVQDGLMYSEMAEPANQVGSTCPAPSFRS